MDVAVVADGEGEAVGVGIVGLDGPVAYAVSPAQDDGGIVVSRVGHHLIGRDVDGVSFLGAFYPVASAIFRDDVLEVNRAIGAFYHLDGSVLIFVSQEHAVVLVFAEHSLSGALIKCVLTFGGCNDDAVFVSHFSSRSILSESEEG